MDVNKCRQSRLQHSGSVWVFDYGLYWRTRDCSLGIFVPPPTSLVKVVNSDSFHWALSVFIYFRFVLTFHVHFAGDLNQKILFVATVLSNTFTRTLLELIPMYFFKFDSYQIECFSEAMGLHRTFEFQSNEQSPFENNFKQMAIV